MILINKMLTKNDLYKEDIYIKWPLQRIYKLREQSHWAIAAQMIAIEKTR